MGADDADADLMNSTANRLYEQFDTVLILASIVVDGRTVWHCSPRGNKFASAEMARRFVAGEFAPNFDDPEQDAPT